LPNVVTPYALHQKIEDENENEHDWGKREAKPFGRVSSVRTGVSRVVPPSDFTPVHCIKRSRTSTRTRTSTILGGRQEQPAFDRYPIKIENEGEHDWGKAIERRTNQN
jgi:hypothetical protein